MVNLPGRHYPHLLVVIYVEVIKVYSIIIVILASRRLIDTFVQSSNNFRKSNSL